MTVAEDAFKCKDIGGNIDDDYGEDDYGDVDYGEDDYGNVDYGDNDSSRTVRSFRGP